MKGDGIRAGEWVLAAGLFLAGAVASLFVAGTVVSVAVLGLGKMDSIELQRQVSLTPVIVAHRALPAGEVLDFDLLSQKAIPEALASESFVGPADVNHVVGSPLLEPMLPGQALRWSHLAGQGPDPSCGWAREARAALEAQCAPRGGLELEQGEDLLWRFWCGDGTAPALRGPP